MPSIIAPAVLAVSLFVIFFRPHFSAIQPWKAMAVGAIAVLLLGAISPIGALHSIDWGVMLFLYGMFVLASGLEHSGYLHHLGVKLVNQFTSPFGLLVAFVFGAGLASALLLNDTVAIVGAPLSIAIAKRSKIRAAPLLLGLALAVTVGSILSPIGNPQNYIIASQPGFSAPFLNFFKYLAVPTMLSLFALLVLLWFLFPSLRKLKKFELDGPRRGDYHAARRAFQSIIVLSLFRIASSFLLLPEFPLYWIAIAGALVYLILSCNLSGALQADWETMLFFAGMFILMGAVWDSGFFQQFMPEQAKLSDPSVIMIASIFFSQVFSNVPFVVLYLKALGPATAKSLVLLAAGSTLAGGITIFGAASNIIILQSAEKRGETLPVKEFMLVGAATVLISSLLILGWIAFIG
ncbi:MAG: SLC13 family permease [Candidatus Micrarchaeota archaeon]